MTHLKILNTYSRKYDQGIYENNCYKDGYRAFVYIAVTVLFCFQIYSKSDTVTNVIACCDKRHILKHAYIGYNWGNERGNAYV